MLALYPFAVETYAACLPFGEINTLSSMDGVAASSCRSDPLVRTR